MMGIRSRQDEDGITMKGQAGVECGGPRQKTSLMHECSSVRGYKDQAECSGGHLPGRGS